MGCVFLASAFYVHIGTYINSGYVDCNDVTIRCPLRIGPTCVSNHLAQLLLFLHQLIGENAWLLCQTVTVEKLMCPGYFANQFYASGYKILTTQLQNFHSLGLLPRNVSFSLLDEGKEMKATLSDGKN